jgi:RNA polymerase sigma-70 factor, ECF subfamily
MSPREERALIRRSLAGDRSAAEALIKAHQGSLYAYMLRRTGRPEVAEDVVQEAFVRALTHLERYDPRFRFSTWLFTIAKRLHVNANQKLSPSFDTDVVMGVGQSEVLGCEQPGAMEAGETVREAVATALDELSGDQREAIVLFYQLEWSVEAIAEYLDQPEGTIKSHLFRGRKKLRESLEARAEQSERLREVLR